MKLFLQLRIGDWRAFSYHQPWLTYASSLTDEVVGAELDSQSDTVVANLVTRLCMEAGTIFILVEATPGPPLGVVLTLINHLYAHEEKIVRIVFQGQHERLEKMLTPFEEKVVRHETDEWLREAIQTFVRKN
jgi:hypothetical protein